MRKKFTSFALILSLFFIGESQALATPVVTPATLSISSVGIKTALIPLGIAKDGSLSVPKTGAVAGWFTGGPKPGEIGPAVIVAHVDWKGKKGVFFDLRKVRVGEIVLVTNSNQEITEFEVTRIFSVKKKSFPTASVYGDLSYPGLRLVTCGNFDLKTKKYVDNIIVYAKAINT